MGGAIQGQITDIGFFDGTEARYRSYGAFVGGPGWGRTLPSTATGANYIRTAGGTVLGLAAGAGGGISITNADKPADLAGVSNAWNLNVGFLGASVSYDDKGHLLVNVGIAKGWGADLSNYHTRTKLTHANESGSSGTSSATSSSHDKSSQASSRNTSSNKESGSPQSQGSGSSLGNYACAVIGGCW